MMEEYAKQKVSEALEKAADAAMFRVVWNIGESYSDYKEKSLREGDGYDTLPVTVRINKNSILRSND